MSEQISLFSGRNGLSLHSENTSILGWASASVGAEDQDAEDELGDEHEDAQGHLHEESVDDQPCEAEPDHDAHKDTIIRQILDGIPANEYLYMADKLESFCFGTDLISVRDEATDVSRRPSAWLYDRNSSGEVHRSRPDKGVLSPCRLDEELSKIRFPSVAYDTQADPVVQAACVTASQGSVASDRGSRNLQDEMDAERRSLFITDLDTSYVHALLGRASVNQAPSLLEMIYRHLIFEPFFIWKTTGPDGPPVQHMAFHLPYYAWRTSSVPRNDPRRYHNGNRLRNVYDVSFLNGNDSQSPSFLYEAEISCTMVAPRDWLWTFYCFCDSFFESKKTRAGSTWNQEVPPGHRTDPFRPGKFISDDQFRDPRVYFLEVCSVRLKQIAGETRPFVEKLRDSVATYEQTHLELRKSHGKISPKEAEDHEVKVREAENYVLQARGFTCMILLWLSQTVESCERFCHDHTMDFEKTAALAGKGALFHSNSQFLVEFRQMQRTLKSLKDKCDNFADDLAYFQQHKANDVSNCQREWTRLSGTIMVCISPIALAVEFLSMPKEIIPFRSLNFASFFYMTIIFGALGLMVYCSFGYVMQFCPPLNFWVRIPYGTSGHGKSKNRAMEENVGARRSEEPHRSAEADRIPRDLENAAPRRIPRRNIVSRLRHATDPPSGT